MRVRKHLKTSENIRIGNIRDERDTMIYNQKKTTSDYNIISESHQFHIKKIR